MKDTTILTNNGINVQASLELFGDMEMYDETLGDFLDMTDEKISSLENFKNANDMPNYAIAVHALKSDGRYLGFTTLADLCYESEMKSKAGDSVFVQENHPKILQEAKRVINLAQQYMGREVTAVIPEGSMAPAAAPAVEAAPVAQPMPTAEVAPAAPMMTEAMPTVAPAPVAMEPQVVYQQSSPVAQDVAMQQTMVQPTETVVMQQPVMQTEQVVQQVPVQPVQEVPTTAAPITPESTVTINFSDAVQQPVATPITQTVQPQMVTQMVEQVVQPVMETQAAVSQEPTIQFFTPDNYQQNDIMSQALYMQQPTMDNPAAVKQGIILVVDDSPLVSNFVKKIFSKNYEVIIASDGQKAIDIVNDDSVRSRIKTCLLDLNMPNVNGFQVMDHFREKGFFVRTPVAIISGAEDAESIEKAKAYPVIDILPKPFNERDVQRVVEKCLACYF